MKNEERFSLKLLDKNDYFSNEMLKEYYNNEAKIGNKVRNNFPHLVSHHGFFYTKHYAVFVYSYYANGTLSSYFSDQDFNLLQIIILLKDIFLGLEELRSLGYIHRNLHELNIYVGSQTIKIGGFEHCEKISASHMSYSYHLFMLDTMTTVLQSISPEMIANRYTSVKTSIYCLGSLLFRLLYKRPHFEANSLDDVLKVYEHKEKVQFPNDLPPDFNKLLRKSLILDAESRLSPYEVKQELCYLFSYCKNFEEEIRASVYMKKTIHAFQDISMRELKNIKLNTHPTLESKPQLQERSAPIGKKLIAFRTIMVISKKKAPVSKVQQEKLSSMPVVSSAFTLQPPKDGMMAMHLREVDFFRQSRARSIHRAEKVINTSMQNRSNAVIRDRKRPSNRSQNASMNMSNSFNTR
jgi:serine/threonine protein kinase